MSAADPPEGRVHLEAQDGVGVLRLDRPARRNALGAQMWAMVAVRVDEAARMGLRALILTGAGPHFCAGMDLKPDNPLLARAAQAVGDGDPVAARALIEELKGVGARLRRFPAPTIAAIEGVCLGGGLELALHCDVRVAAETAQLGMPEVRLGMVPDVGGTALLSRLVGPGRAIALICSGRAVDARRAHPPGPA
jgi:enoyl-CoA hydratase/carnithine racemase